MITTACRAARTAALLLTLAAARAGAQLAPQPPFPDSRRADLGPLSVEYFEFGVPGGPPVVFLQDFHDYFRLEEAAEWRTYLARFGDTYRVLAPVRRGYGASDDPRWGFDVPTLAEDVIRFLDALGIGRAVMVGRVPATQEMTWLAEHHPDRLAGLVFIERPHLIADMRDPELREWAEAFWRSACDLGDRAVAITGPRSTWQPDFMTDTTRRIAIPAALLTEPRFAGSMDLRILEMVLAEAGRPDTASTPACDPTVPQYYRALAKDPARVARLRERLAAGEARVEALATAMDRAFGASLRIVTYEFTPGGTAWPEPWYRHTRAFLDARLARGRWR